MINVDDAHLARVTEYLDKREISWREMTTAAYGKKGGEA